MTGEDLFSHQSALFSTNSNVPGSFSGSPVARRGSGKLLILPQAQEKPQKLNALCGCTTMSSCIGDALSANNDKLGSGTLLSSPHKLKKESSLARHDQSYVFSERVGLKMDDQHQPGLTQCMKVS